MGHPPLRSFLQHTAHSMPFPSSEGRHQNLSVHMNTSAAFSLCTIHLMQWMLAHTGKNCSTNKPLTRRRSLYSSAISDPTAVIPCSGVGRKHILQGVRDHEVRSLPGDSPPQTPSTWLQLEANGMQECGVCHSTLPAPCSRTACVWSLVADRN